MKWPQPCGCGVLWWVLVVWGLHVARVTARIRAASENNDMCE